MANPLDTTPALQACSLVEFSWGSSIVRYAAYTSDVTYNGYTFTSQPSISIEYGRQDGTTKDQPTTISMRVLPPLDAMRQTHPPVKVRIWELNPGNDLTAAKMWAGRISNIRYNADGNPGVCKVTISGWKTGLECSLSLTAGRFCEWPFGGKICGKDLDAIKEAATIVDVDGTVITVTGLTTINVPDWWRAGYVKVDGFTVKIHDHKVGETQLTLCKPPPLAWVGASAYVYPGCDKTQESCTKHGRLSRFGALGIKIPNRDVRYED